MVPLRIVALIAAIICFALAALNVGSPRVNLLALGLALWCATTITVAC